MTEKAAHQTWWQVFEVVFGVPLLAAIILQRIAPLSLPRGWFTPIFLTLGSLFMLSGLTLMTLARYELRKYAQPTEPGQPTHKIVSTSVFSISRNPLYLGGVSFLAGLSLAFNLPWILISLLPGLVACHYILIAPEERYLAARFGEEYRAYAKQVNRWIGYTRKGALHHDP